MKLCFSTLGCADRSLDSILTLVRENGMDAVEIRGIDGKMFLGEHPDFAPEKIAQVKERFLKSGVKPLSLNLSYAGHDIGYSEDGFAPYVRELEIAAALEIPYLRVFGDCIEGDREEAIGKILYALKKITKAAQKGGQTVLLEVHGDINSVETLEPVLSEMQVFDNFGLIWDIANSDMVYKENWQPLYEYIRPFIKHVHIKDHIRETLTLTDLGKGEIPIRAIVDRMLADGYEGYFSLEWEKKWHPELSEIEDALKDYQRIMTQ